MNETIAVMEYPDLSRGLFTNGHSMSNNQIDAQRYMRGFSHIPLLIHERPRTAMVMCFGVGNTLHSALLHPLERVDLVDLSEDVLEHAHWFAATNHDALRDPRVQVFVNDARQHLRMTPPESYDLITGEPPPITHAGVVALYSREFFALARSRLRPGGLISYWLPIRQATPDAARSLVRGFVDVFPDSVLLSGGRGELILLGRVGGPPQLDPEHVRARLAELPLVAKDLHDVYLGRLQELFSTFVASAETMRNATFSSPALTDDRPILEYSAPSDSRVFNLPANLFDVSDAASWCPTCLAPRTGRPTTHPRPTRCISSSCGGSIRSRSSCAPGPASSGSRCPACRPAKSPRRRCAGASSCAACSGWARASTSAQRSSSPRAGSRRGSACWRTWCSSCRAAPRPTRISARPTGARDARPRPAASSSARSRYPPPSSGRAPVGRAARPSRLDAQVEGLRARQRLVAEARERHTAARVLDAGPRQRRVEVVAAVHEHGAGLDLARRARAPRRRRSSRSKR